MGFVQVVNKRFLDASNDSCRELGTPAQILIQPKIIIIIMITKKKERKETRLDAREYG